MRTTLDLENDVLDAAKELARQENVAIGKVISRLVRDALTGRASLHRPLLQDGVAGFRPFAARGTLVTNEMVDKLRDGEGV